jgi:asparagine synthase (glutamine-hydrolysing)
MCGIAGIVNLDGRPVDRAAVEAMIRAQEHRGPDGDGYWCEGNVGFGHARLAIRDLGEGGRQPMHDATRTVAMVYNGEIYNEEVIRAKLSAESGTEFHTRCDAEVIAPGWVSWGADLFTLLEGMFAVAIWDARSSSLILARDPVGIKPLYYSQRGKSIRFASELKGLLAVPDQEVQLSPADLHRYLGSGYPGPTRSLLVGVGQVPPGSFLVANRDGVRIERYWTPKRTGEIRDIDAALEEFAGIWPRTVEESLISDVPVGLLLSGGIDSSLIATALRGRNSPAFTAKFTAAGWDETPSAAAVAAATGLPHHVAPVDSQADAEETFLAVARHVDGQLADSSCFPFYKVCRAARKAVPVLLSGDGADEFFAGYETYRASRFASGVVRVVPRALLRAGGRMLMTRQGAGAVSTAEKMWRFLLGVAEAPTRTAHAQWRRYLLKDQQAGLYAPEMADAAEVDALADYAALLTDAGGSTIDRCLLADQLYYLPGDMLLKSDLMSMAHGLELRVPFLHPRIMEFAGRLHADLLSPLRGPDKRILRAAGTRFGLGEAITARKKHGFNMPIAAMLREGLRPLCEKLLDRNADILAPHLRADGVRHLWRQHSSGDINHAYVLWSLLTLAAWKSGLSRTGKASLS